MLQTPDWHFQNLHQDIGRSTWSREVALSDLLNNHYQKTCERNK